MTTVAATDDNGMFAFSIGLGTFELGRMTEVSLERIHAFKFGKVHFTAMACGLDDVVGMECSIFCCPIRTASLKGYSPLSF